MMAARLRGPGFLDGNTRLQRNRSHWAYGVSEFPKFNRRIGFAYVAAFCGQFPSEFEDLDPPFGVGRLVSEMIFSVAYLCLA